MEDPKLPALARATDNLALRSLLPPALGIGGSKAGEDLPEVQHQVIKYKPGKHCVIRYRLRYGPAGAQERLVMGKLYRERRGEQRFRDLMALWNASRPEQPGSFHMPRPLAYLPELGMVLQEIAPGQALDRSQEIAELQKALPLAAVNLAALHRLSAKLEVRDRMEEHLRRYCHPGPELLARDYPDLLPTVKRVLGRLYREETLHGLLLCPVHGDLGLGEVFISDGRACFVDFDGTCLSHPALDLANFTVGLKSHFPQQGEQLSEIFLSAYLERQSPRALEGLAAYQALACLRRVMIAFRKLAGSERERQIRGLLEMAEAALSC